MQAPPDGLIVQLFGVGTAPSVEAWASLIDTLASNGVPAVAVSACPEGQVEWHRYQASAALAQSALINASDMTFECAYVKLLGVVAEKLSHASAVTRFVTPVCHELTVADSSGIA